MTKTQPEGRADRPICVKLTAAELAEFDEQIRSLGLKRNRALRIAARRIGGFLETDPRTYEALVDISRQLHGVGVNINQMAHAVNRGAAPDYERFTAERASLAPVMASLIDALEELINVSTRREDGLERLEKAAAQ